MTQWSDLPTEIQFDIIKFTIADILQDHIDRVSPGVYWGAYPDYVYPLEEGVDPNIRENDDYDFDSDYDMYTELGDGCEYQDPWESSRFAFMLVVSKAFLTPDDLKHILLRCGCVSCPSPQHLSQFKDSFTPAQRRSFRVMWIRPQNNIPLIDKTFTFFGPENQGLSLYRCLLYFPNLKVINLQLERYLAASVDIDFRSDEGRLLNPMHCQDILNNLYYKSEWKKRDMPWLAHILFNSVVLTGKVELRVSFEAHLNSTWRYRDSPAPVATFSSKDFCVRVDHDGSGSMIKQPNDEHIYRQTAVGSRKRSSFKELPEGLQALINAKARD